MLAAIAFAVVGLRGSELPAAQRGSRDVLTAAQWARLDQAVDRGLKYLASEQQPDGAFKTLAAGQPAITSLGVMAFLSRGHVPGHGPYGDVINLAIEFVLSTQQDNGLLYGLPISQNWERFDGSHTAIYNHAIAGLMLAEVYGMTQDEQQARIGAAVDKALTYTRQRQIAPKRRNVDDGGWRYVVEYAANDSDLSVTSWQLMFLRSARNAEFHVPEEFISEAMDYIRSCFDDMQATFIYAESERRPSGGIVGGGILALALGGEHQTPLALQAGEWILTHRHRLYNGPGVHELDRYHYSTYYCSQAMFQLGGHYWAQYYPDLLDTLLENQRDDGSWEPESVNDGPYGSTYTTALAVLALTPPYQLLPLYQK
ncbi:MAG: prenyltransferase/squalene oxidase repeat-containing protein [Planctomycetaceae bacterium]